MAAKQACTNTNLRTVSGPWQAGPTIGKRTLMRGDAKKLAKMLQGAQTRFVIPVYQRNYDWKREQCKRLFDDLEDVVQQSRESLFLAALSPR
ncbi:DUF262 domain-containing protein [Bifidobacterium hapali]|uniref:GmrSD restriction endonuclease domain-containing protein n=1 Tax=Bifidobacterium hapali TaxID=1630172 RepID=UPI00117779E3